MRNSIALATFIVAFGFILSRFLGVIRQVVITSVFGMENAELAAFFVAFRIPDLLFQLLAGATLSSALIPVLSKTWTTEGSSAAWRLASSILNILFFVTLVMSILCFVFTPALIPVIAPGLEDMGVKDICVRLTRIMLITPIIFCISGITTGILNGREHFLMPAIAPCVYNLGIIAAGIFLVDRYGVESLSYGVIAGASLHLAVQIPALFRKGFRWSPDLRFNDLGVRKIFSLAGPRMIGLAATQINTLVIILFASLISVEAINVITISIMVMMLPVGIAGMSLGTVFFPALVARVSAGEVAEYRSDLFLAVRATLWIASPLCLGLFLLSDGIVELIFEYGAFDSYATKTVAQVVQILALAGFSYSLVEILSRGFYALSDTKTPVFVAVLAMCANLLLASLVIGLWGGDVESLVWVIVTSGMFEFVILAVLLQRRAKFLQPRYFGMPAMGIIFGLISLGISVSAVESLLSEIVLTLKIPSLVVIGGMIYTLVTSVFDADLRRRMLYQVFRSIPGAGKFSRKS